MSKKLPPLTTRRGTEILFFDLQEIDEQQRVVLAVCEAQKHARNPVMELGQNDEWDSAQASPWPQRTVIYDEEERIWKMWYAGTDPSPNRVWYSGYAVSDDGLVWRKPKLGIFEYRGSRDNNIILESPYGCVIKDHAEKDPAKRYKMTITHRTRYSADGIHWTDWVRHGMDFPGPKMWDSVVFIRDDQDPDPNRRYKYIYQYYGKPNKPGPDEVRMKGMVFGSHESRWLALADNPILSPNDGFEHENHFVMYIPYKGQWLMLYECGWYHPDGTGKYGEYTADIRLAHSRDGEHFTRICPDQAVIPRGRHGAWDEQFLVIVDKAVIKDDTIYLYYCGQGADWTSWPALDQAPNLEFGPGAMSLSRTGLATLRLDGFTCMQVADQESFGSLTTKPFAHDPKHRTQLTVNVSETLPRRSWLQVEVLDARTRKPVSGFTREDCEPILTDGVRIPVRWRGQGLGAVKAKSIRLRFHLFGTSKLHSFKFA